MPVSSKGGGADEGDKGGSAGSEGTGKRASKPTSKARRQRQRTKDRYAHAREDAQLEGLIPTTPEEALTPERVPASAQNEQPQPQLIAEAIRRGWAVPDWLKPTLVDELVALINSTEASEKVKVAAFNALRMADEAQYERDYPERAAKAKGTASGSTTTIGSINIQNNVQAAALIREMITNGELGILEEVQPPNLTGAPGSGGLEREVEASAAPEGDQQRAGESVADAE